MARYERNEDRDQLGELWRRNDEHSEHIRALYRRKYLEAWVNPTYANSWDNPGAPYQNFQYRLTNGDRWEPRGTLTGGADGTVAFTLPLPWRPIADESHVVQTDTGPANAYIDAATGDVTITRMGAAATQSMWPLKYYLVDPIADSIGIDGVNPYFGGSIDTTYWSGGILFATGNNAAAYFIVRLGPYGSYWALQFGVEIGPNCGKVDFAWATLPNQEDVPVGYGLTFPEGALDSTSGGGATFYTNGSGELTDLYAVSTNKNNFYGQFFQQLRIVGQPGDQLTANGTFSGTDFAYRMNGGPGLWVLRVRVNGQNVSSSGFRVAFTQLNLMRMTWDGYPVH